MRDFNNYKLFTYKNSKFYPSKTNEILGYISQKIFDSSCSSSVNSNLNSSEHLLLLMFSIFDKINILVHKINKLDTRIRLTFKESIYDQSINVKTEKLSNCTIKSDKGHQTENIYNYNQHISK